MEQLSVVSLWMIKGCLLLLYNRLTIQSLRTREHRLVQVVAVYVIVTFIVLEILFWAVWCVPPQKYWAYLPAGDRRAMHAFLESSNYNYCLEYLFRFIDTEYPNPFAHPAPDFKEKIATCAVFSLGGLVIVLAAINKSYNLSGTHRAVFLVSLPCSMLILAELYNDRFQRWHIAELATAVYTSNIPLLWPLCIRVFHKLRGSTDYSQPSEPHRLITAPRQIIPFPARSIHRKNSKHSIVRVSYERDEIKAMLHELALITPRERGYSAIISGFPATHPRTTKDITVQRTVEIVNEPLNDNTWTGDSMISPPSPSWRRSEQ
ncbi:hypothetical protein AARAC_009884 [Aspergillus arachidicola]|uniref:Integral membrane protein n=1 Tax=Aspergillus arachidicola TaxID=656916 RepID=A0A2G7GBM2_9EURO|nr:hypothetical protein AARAC_009884 [Aspergillus arachidicola]